MNRLLLPLALLAVAAPAAAQDADPARGPCAERDYAALRRNPTAAEMRCRYGAHGPGRFGLLSYADVPVYQPATPMPGTHIAGVSGHARPLAGESFEAWEWRVHRSAYGPEVQAVHRGLDLLHPFAATRIMEFERRLREAGVQATRRETWRDPRRQEYLFQQGRSRPGPIATSTLTSWHGEVDAEGRPAGRAVDYTVPGAHLPRFHEIAASVGLSSFGADSNDPGHVFLPPDDALAAGEVVLLRTLPRVPEVTLATGLPVDRAIPPGGLEVVREAARAFAATPRFVAFPVARVVGAEAPAVRVRAPAGVALTPPTAPAPPAAGGAPGAPSGGGSPASGERDRSRGG